MTHSPLRVPSLARLAVLAVVFLVWIFSVAAMARAYVNEQPRVAAADPITKLGLAQNDGGGRRLPAPLAGMMPQG